MRLLHCQHFHPVVECHLVWSQHRHFVITLTECHAHGLHHHRVDLNLHPHHTIHRQNHPLSPDQQQFHKSIDLTDHFLWR